MTPLTVRQALVQCSLIPLEAQVLLAHVLRVERPWLRAHESDRLPPAKATAFFALARRRLNGEPVAYLTGFREFWGLALAVTPNVLIPRPETETLVEQALLRLPRDRELRVLDLGTGSGAVALALARERPQATIVATDISDAALTVARANARRVGVFNVEFVLADWYAHDALDRTASPFDAIVSNPPYIGAGDPHLSQGDLRYEPMAALTSGVDGLDALRTIVAGAPDRLAEGGFLAVEHGYDQAPALREMLASAGFVNVESVRDLAGIQRVAIGRRG
ncbi:MAG TPA: peptide chain release factor N(5)-glutamine methyltransferase [Casimicrobiaceae bacterium]|nr:peptide chain release factor N(5)-glutamine methyltransferase [Casimicrobiaceae bacterium]